MKKRNILNIIIDIFLMAVVLSFVDYLMINILKKESFWLELGIYIVFYSIVFGTKSWIVYLWNKKRKGNEKHH